MTANEFYAQSNDAVRPVLDAMSSSDLVNLYNTLTGSKVKKFSSKEDGLRRIWRARRQQTERQPEGHYVADDTCVPTAKVADAKLLLVQNGEVVGKALTEAEAASFNRSQANAPHVPAPVVVTAEEVVAMAKPVADNLRNLIVQHAVENGGATTQEIGSANAVAFTVEGLDAVVVYFADIKKSLEFETSVRETEGVKEVNAWTLTRKERAKVAEATLLSKAQQPVGQAARPMPKPTRREGDATTVIRLATTVNPKKEGSAAFDRFELYVDEMTVEAALKAGVTREDIRWDVKHGSIKLEEPTVKQ